MVEEHKRKCVRLCGEGGGGHTGRWLELRWVRSQAQVQMYVQDHSTAHFTGSCERVAWHMSAQPLGAKLGRWQGRELEGS